MSDTPTPAPAPMTASRLMELLDIAGRNPSDIALKKEIERQLREGADALTSRVSRLLEAVEGAEKALEYYAANCADMPPWRVTDAAGGLIADWEGFTERARSALATLRAAREGAR